MADHPTVTPYELLGGDGAVRGLVDAFYDLMDDDPAYVDIRRLHPGSLKSSRNKLYMFLSGWLGGPSLYIERYGHPRLRARHLPFAIGARERDQWVGCMTRALEERGVEGELRTMLERQFLQVADFMRNQHEGERGGGGPTLPIRG